MFGERLKALRNSFNMTQLQVAGKIGVTRAAYSHFENGRNQPDSETIVKLAEIFEVSTDYLLGKSEMKQPNDAQKRELTIQQALDGVMSYDGEPLTDNDREVLRRIIEGYLDKK